MDAVDFAIDMETLGIHSGCVVLSIGLVVFNPYSDDIIDKYYWEPDIQKQLDDGLTIEANTLAWWAMKEDPKEREILQNTLHSEDDSVATGKKPVLESVIAEINSFYHKHKDEGDRYSRLWCAGTDFDVAMIRYLCNKYKINYPFHYRAARDLRTFCDALNVDRNEIEMTEGLKKHNALDDAIHCANVVQYAYANRHVKDVNDYM